ncbi:MAG TPA: OB-fold nucleic acid binding domain-containing protein [Nitrospira sp.]|jgi:cytochrome c-type biogenesis protein CcmE
MKVHFQLIVATVLALSLAAPLAWAGNVPDVASLLENPASYQSKIVRMTGTVSNHKIRRGTSKCFQMFTLEDDTGSIEAVYKANCSGARNSLRDRDVVTLEGSFERTSGNSGMLKVRSILSKVAPSAQ